MKRHGRIIKSQHLNPIIMLFILTVVISMTSFPADAALVWHHTRASAISGAQKARSHEIVQQRIEEKRAADLNKAVPGQKALEVKYGIRITGIRPSSAQLMLDLRYTVMDPDKARLFLSETTHPYLIHNKTGSRLLIPSTAKAGSLRQTSRLPKAGRSYFMMFVNPGTLVKPGDTLTLVIEDIKIDNLTLL